MESTIWTMKHLNWRVLNILKVVHISRLQWINLWSLIWIYLRSKGMHLWNQSLMMSLVGSISTECLGIVEINLEIANFILIYPCLIWIEEVLNNLQILIAYFWSWFYGPRWLEIQKVSRLVILMWNFLDFISMSCQTLILVMICDWIVIINTLLITSKRLEINKQSILIHCLVVLLCSHDVLICEHESSSHVNAIVAHFISLLSVIKSHWKWCF